MNGLLDLDIPELNNVRPNNNTNSHEGNGGGDDGAHLGGLLFFSQRMRLKPIVTMTAGRCENGRGIPRHQSSSGEDTNGSSYRHHQYNTSNNPPLLQPMNHLHNHRTQHHHHHHQPLTSSTSRRHPQYTDAMKPTVGDGPRNSTTTTTRERTPPYHVAALHYYLNNNYNSEDADNSTYTNSTPVGNFSVILSESPERSSTNAVVAKNGGVIDYSSTTPTSTTASGNAVGGGLTSTASWPSVQMQKAPRQETRIVTTPATEGGCVLYARGVASTTAIPTYRHYYSPPTEAVSRSKHINSNFVQQQQQDSSGAASSTSCKPIPTFDSADTGFASTSTTNSKTTKDTTTNKYRCRTTPDAISPGSGFSMCSHTPLMGHRTSDTSSFANSIPRTFSSSSKQLYTSGNNNNTDGAHSRFGGDGGSGKKNVNKSPSSTKKSCGTGGGSVNVEGKLMKMGVKCDTSTPLSSSVYRGGESATAGECKRETDGSHHNLQHQHRHRPPYHQYDSFSQDSCGWVLGKSIDHDDMGLPPQHPPHPTPPPTQKRN